MSKEKGNLTHNILTVVGTVLCVILVPILIINITLIIKSFTNKDEVPSVGGIFPLIVLTDSMYPEIESGDLIINKTIDPEEVKNGDVISFFDPAGNGTTIVTHRVVGITSEDGGIAFRTKGDYNNTEDKLSGRRCCRRLLCKNPQCGTCCNVYANHNRTYNLRCSSDNPSCCL